MHTAPQDVYKRQDIGRTGRFRKPLTYMQAIELAANQLNMSIRQLRACGDLNTEITSVGI